MSTGERKGAEGRGGEGGEVGEEGGGEGDRMAWEVGGRVRGKVGWDGGDG